MKKFISFFLFASMIFVATPTETKAQTASTFKFSKTATNASSTITNTGTDTMTLYLPGYYHTVAFQPVVTKTSGTVAGSVVIYGSIDGINFETTGDTLTLANQTTNTAFFRHTDPYWVYYRAKATGSGTMVATAQIYYTARKP